MLKVLRALVLFLICGLAVAEEEMQKPRGGEPGWQPPKQKSFTDKEIKDECRKYNGKYIGYYGKVFKVKSCKRLLIDSQNVERLMKRRVNIKEVGIATIAKIPLGVAQAKTKGSSCKRLDGRYVLSTGGDMYFIKNCKKYRFLDWESYTDHAKNSKQKKVFELSDAEFHALEKGRAFPSVLDAEYGQEKISTLEVDLIPLDEACAGINGKLVSYYSKIYKVEKCHKREIIDPSSFTKKKSFRKVKELSSEQWLSLPNGKPM